MSARFCRCGKRIEGRLLCERCDPTPKTGERGYDHQWRKLSEAYRTDHPTCADCEAKDIVTPATQVHHEIPIRTAPGRRLDPANLVSLCDVCHEARHGREATGDVVTGGRIFTGGGCG